MKFDKTMENITEQLVLNGVINSEDREIYSYGLKQGLVIVLNLVTTIVIGLIAGMVWQSILFMAAYIPLRTYAGGYHANTQTMCYVLSIILISVVLLIIKIIPWTNFICLVNAIVAACIIFVFAPVEDMNKQLDKVEVAVYKKRARIMLIFEFFILLFMMMLKCNQVSVCISMSFLALSIMLILGKIKNMKIIV